MPLERSRRRAKPISITNPDPIRPKVPASGTALTGVLAAEHPGELPPHRRPNTAMPPAITPVIPPLIGSVEEFMSFRNHKSDLRTAPLVESRHIESRSVLNARLVPDVGKSSCLLIPQAAPGASELPLASLVMVRWSRSSVMVVAEAAGKFASIAAESNSKVGR
jgi:hypothetical protein